MISIINKKRILWVVFDFVQAGGQRYVYEICKALDRTAYELHFLRATSYGHDTNWDVEHYHSKTTELGCEIFLLEDILSSRNEFNRTSRSVFPHLSLRKNRYQEQINLTSFFAMYDIVNFSGVGVYDLVCNNYNVHPTNSLIHVLTAKFQDEKMYDNYRKDLPYHFVCATPIEFLSEELSDFTNFKYTYFPLSFDTDGYKTLITNEAKKGAFQIALFTRLSPLKPLDPFFYAIKLLHEVGLNVNLNVFGAGNPKELGLTRQLAYLHIKEIVDFKGHVKSIQDTLQSNPPDQIWFQAANGQPGGYAALETCLTGLPHLFWEFANIGNDDTEGAIRTFTKLHDFVETSEHLLNDKKAALSLGFQQQKYVRQAHSINNHIHILEKIFNAF